MNDSPSFEELSEFTHEFKKLKNKYKTLDADFERFKKVLKAKLPDLPPGTVVINNLGEEVPIPIYKVKKFRCVCLKGKGSRSGIRIIYTFVDDAYSFIFIEIYHKNKKETENRARIYKYFKNNDLC